MRRRRCDVCNRTWLLEDGELCPNCDNTPTALAQRQEALSDWRAAWHARLKKLDRDLALAILVAVILGGPFVWILSR
ncbi:MAG: hypothetical protein JSV16_08655, partial [Candidatus Hydrogenedentota bacterium]